MTGGFAGLMVSFTTWKLTIFRIGWFFFAGYPPQKKHKQSIIWLVVFSNIFLMFSPIYLGKMSNPIWRSHIFGTAWVETWVSTFPERNHLPNLAIIRCFLEFFSDASLIWWSSDRRFWGIFSWSVLSRFVGLVGHKRTKCRVWCFQFSSKNHIPVTSIAGNTPCLIGSLR